MMQPKVGKYPKIPWIKLIRTDFEAKAKMGTVHTIAIVFWFWGNTAVANFHPCSDVSVVLYCWCWLVVCGQTTHKIARWYFGVSSPEELLAAGSRWEPRKFSCTTARSLVPSLCGWIGSWKSLEIPGKANTVLTRCSQGWLSKKKREGFLFFNHRAFPCVEYLDILMAERGKNTTYNVHRFPLDFPS